MRKIEKEMLAAIKAGKAWKKDNTEVVCSAYAEEKRGMNVFLHNNLIARVDVFASTSVSICLCGWNSPTTRSRLSAIIREFSKQPGPHGLGVSTKKGQVCLHDASGITNIDATSWWSVVL